MGFELQPFASSCCAPTHVPIESADNTILVHQPELVVLVFPLPQAGQPLRKRGRHEWPLFQVPLAQPCDSWLQGETCPKHPPTARPERFPLFCLGLSEEEGGRGSFSLNGDIWVSICRLLRFPDGGPLGIPSRRKGKWSSGVEKKQGVMKRSLESEVASLLSCQASVKRPMSTWQAAGHSGDLSDVISLEKTSLMMV